MGETFQKQVNVREADSKSRGNTKTEADERPTKASVERELKVEAKAEEKTKVAEALKKSEKAVEKPTMKPASTATPAAAKAPEAKKEEEKPVEKREIVLERVYTIPLEDAYAKPAKKRAARAVKLLRQFLSRHMKSQNVKISPEVNEFIEERGATSPMKKVRVNASKDKAGMVLAKLAGME